MILLLIVYDSLTGNVERFVNKLPKKYEKIKIEDGLIIEEPYVLITYTFDFGREPITTEDFLDDNHDFLRGVAASGNRNWGSSYGRAAEVISKKYDVPIIHKFELSGTRKDVEIVTEGVALLGK